MVDAAHAHALAVLTRAPSSGGKSRLFAELGCAPDPRLLEALLLDTISRAAPPGARVVVAVTPGSACDEIRELLMSRLKPAPAIDVVPQGTGDLGERMRATMADLFEQGARAVALIGSDLPHITRAPVAAAFEALDRDPDALVLGPAADGGYYLIAARRVPDVFAGIEWGSERVLEQTRQAAQADGFQVRLLASMRDVDAAADLRDICGGDGPPPRTAAWLRDFRIY
jgi:rSAM/selenodomain-associated transferase 1